MLQKMNSFWYNFSTYTLDKRLNGVSDIFRLWVFCKTLCSSDFFVPLRLRKTNWISFYITLLSWELLLN